MRELINLIPFLDVAIIALLLFFLYLGFRGGVPRMVMAIGAIYTGFLLASVYYHLFAVAFSTMFKTATGFVTDLISFLALDVLITTLMVALLLNVFGHIEIRGRVAVFDKVGGTVMGLLAGVLVIGILITLLRVPYEANAQKINSVAEMPIVQVFNNAYEKSALSPVFLKAAPIFVSSMTPMLPEQTRQRGAVPLLESIVAHR